MKAITPYHFKIVLKAAAILTDAQELKDKTSVDIAYELWRYIDLCRKRHPYLKDVLL